MLCASLAVACLPLGAGAQSSISAESTALPLLTVNAQEPVPRRALGRDLPVYMPAPGEREPREASHVRNPTGAISLRDALGLALLQNPGLAAFGWEVRAREARLLQSRRPPNPTLGAVLEDLGAPRFADGSLNEPIQPQTTIQLSQLIELGGKRAARQRLAGLHRDLAAWDYETARIDVLTEVTRTFTDVLAAQQTVAQVEGTIRLAEQVRDTVALRVVAGVVSPIEETRAGVAQASVQVELARARRLLDALRTRLALMWGSPTAVFASVEGDLMAEPPPLPSLTALASRMEENPDLARWAAEISQRQAAVDVERSKAVPDLSLTAGYRRFTTVDANALVVGASISLPFFDKNRAGVQDAQLRVAKAAEEKRATEMRVAAALADAYAALASAHDEISTLRSAVLPGSQQAFEAVNEGYRLGRFGFLDVLESQRTLVTASSQHLRALSDYHKAAATVERLIGAPLDDGPAQK